MFLNLMFIHDQHFAFQTWLNENMWGFFFHIHIFASTYLGSILSRVLNLKLVSYEVLVRKLNDVSC